MEKINYTINRRTKENINNVISAEVVKKSIKKVIEASMPIK